MISITKIREVVQKIGYFLGIFYTYMIFWSININKQWYLQCYVYTTFMVIKYMSNVCYVYVINSQVVRKFVCYVTVVTSYHYSFQILQTDHNNIRLTLIYDCDMIIYIIYLFQIKLQLNVYLSIQVTTNVYRLGGIFNRLFKYVKLIHSLWMQLFHKQIYILN